MNNGKICIKILCEGLEEYKYIKKLISFPGIFSSVYYFDEPINCKGINKIFPRYQDLFTKNLFEVILIFCDADNNSDDFGLLCSKINNCMFGGADVSNSIVMFVNPVTLQIVLSHLADVKIISSSKANNEGLIFQLTGITDYRAHEKQIDEMMKFVKFSNYKDMRKRVDSLSQNISEVPSSNFGVFLSNFEKSDTQWVDDIIKKTTNVE